MTQTDRSPLTYRSRGYGTCDGQIKKAGSRGYQGNSSFISFTGGRNGGNRESFPTASGGVNSEIMHSELERSVTMGV